jgi:AraC-like DNA-binding protein
MAERADPFHKLIYVLHGRVSFSTNGRTSPTAAPAGSVICVEEGVRHRIEDASPPTLLLLCFSRAFVQREPGLALLWKDIAGGATCRRPGRAWGHRFESLWRGAIVEQTGALPGHEAAVGAAAVGILVSLARLPAGPVTDQARRRVESVVREMTETFYEPWNLERACGRAAMSRRHFSSLFRTVTGRTFLEELTQLRLAHAAQLLRAGQHSVLGAAFSSGYGDLSHFYRLFRTRYGQPPGALAARTKEKP